MKVDYYHNIYLDGLTETVSPVPRASLLAFFNAKMMHPGGRNQCQYSNLCKKKNTKPLGTCLTGGKTDKVKAVSVKIIY